MIFKKLDGKHTWMLALHLQGRAFAAISCSLSTNPQMILNRSEIKARWDRMMVLHTL